MKLRPDQERVRALICDTLTLLCKNGLKYDFEFSVDALIGITLDKGEVFLVNISETVTKGGVAPEPEPSSNVSLRKRKFFDDTYNFVQNGSAAALSSYSQQLLKSRRLMADSSLAAAAMFGLESHASIPLSQAVDLSDNPATLAQAPSAVVIQPEAEIAPASGTESVDGAEAAQATGRDVWPDQYTAIPSLLTEHLPMNGSPSAPQVSLYSLHTYLFNHVWVTGLCWLYCMSEP